MTLEFVCTIAALLSCAQDETPEAKTAATLQRLYNDGRYGDMYAMMSPTLTERFTEQDFESHFRDLRRRLGKWTWSGPLKMQQGVAIVPARFEKGEQEVRFSLDGDGRIEVIGFDPPAGGQEKARRHSTEMGLPFKGTWAVVEARSGRLGFRMVDGDGKTHRGDGTKNAQFEGWGKDVLAPADGVVVEAIDGVRDNEPGKVVGLHAPMGNCVTIRHADGEFSVLSHLMRGSVKVKAGDRVKAGKVVGKCGNSGDSSEPQLRLRVVDSDVIDKASGLEIHFMKLKRSRESDSEEVEDYSPIQEDVVSP